MNPFITIIKLFLKKLKTRPFMKFFKKKVCLKKNRTKKSLFNFLE
jgi:hypothetical protein